MSYKMIYLAHRSPVVSRAEWPETWASHARLVFEIPVFRNAIRWLRYCNRVDTTTLDGRAITIPWLSNEHDGVGVGSRRTLHGMGGAGASEEDRARVTEDERRVFDMSKPAYICYGTETAVRDGAYGGAALFMFLAPHRDTTSAQFAERWNGAHLALARDCIASCPAITHYGHNLAEQVPSPVYPFGGVIDCWFDTVEDALRVIEAGTLNPVRRDLASFCDEEAGLAMLTSVCNNVSMEE